MYHHRGCIINLPCTITVDHSLAQQQQRQQQERGQSEAAEQPAAHSRNRDSQYQQENLNFMAYAGLCLDPCDNHLCSLHSAKQRAPSTCSLDTATSAQQELLLLTHAPAIRRKNGWAMRLASPHSMRARQMTTNSGSKQKSCQALLTCWRQWLCKMPQWTYCCLLHKRLIVATLPAVPAESF
jgi:hypothetical protein